MEDRDKGRTVVGLGSKPLLGQQSKQKQRRSSIPPGSERSHLQSAADDQDHSLQAWPSVNESWLLEKHFFPQSLHVMYAWTLET